MLEEAEAIYHLSMYVLVKTLQKIKVKSKILLLGYKDKINATYACFKSPMFHITHKSLLQDVVYFSFLIFFFF